MFPMDALTSAKKKAAVWATRLRSYVCPRCEVVRFRLCAFLSRPMHIFFPDCDGRALVLGVQAHCLCERGKVCLIVCHCVCVWFFLGFVCFCAGPDPMRTQGTLPLLPDGDVINWGAPKTHSATIMRPERFELPTFGAQSLGTIFTSGAHGEPPPSPFSSFLVSPFRRWHIFMEDPRGKRRS